MLIFPTPKLSPFTGMVGYGGGASGLNIFAGGIPKLPTTANYDSDKSLGNDDFCLEFFFRATGTSQQCMAGYANDTPILEIDQTAPRVYCGTNGFTGSAGFDFHSGSVSANTWYHYAFVRDDGANNNADERNTGYFNGAKFGTQTRSGDYTNEQLTIGARGNATVPFTGWISNLRLTIGISRYGYTSNYTVPSLPLSVDSNTVLYCCNHPNPGDAQFNGGTVQLDVTGNPQVVTNQLPTGADYAVYFDGNDYLRTPT